LDWLNKAVALGDKHAAYFLGAMYLDGDEIPQDLLKANLLLNESGLAEHPAPGAIYYKGKLTNFKATQNKHDLPWSFKYVQITNLGILLLNDQKLTNSYLYSNPELRGCSYIKALKTSSGSAAAITFDYSTTHSFDLPSTIELSEFKGAVAQACPKLVTK
jgi:hypothetical protein